MKYKPIIVITFLILSAALNCFGFRETVHREANGNAIANRMLSNPAISNFPIQLGYSSVNSRVMGTKIVDWFINAGAQEDKPAWRTRHHFLDPVSNVGFSGLVGGAFQLGEPTVVWAQKGVGQQSVLAGGAYSWEDARDYFHTALTSATPAVREQKLADSFRAVGQVMHLVADMSVPEHTRDTSHIRSKTIEAWLEEVLNKDTSTPLYAKYYPRMLNSLNNPVPPSPTLLQQSGKFPGAPIPIANLYDSETYSGTNPGVTVAGPIGLAEYTNANFFSIDTIFKNYDHPSKSSVQDYEEIDEESGKLVKFVRRVSDGEPVEHLAQATVFHKYIFFKENGYTIENDKIYADYMDKLIPRAVGYAGALFDYFFRGTVNITTTPGDISFRSVKVTATNTTANEAMGTGEARLVIRYKELSENQLSGNKYLLNTPSADYTYKVSAPLTVDLTTPQQLTFDFSNDTLPYFFDDMTMQLVFKGKLGNEEGAVAVSKLEPVTGIYSDFDITLPASGVYAKTSDLSSSGTFGEIKVNAQTDIAGGLTGGALKLVLEYSEATTDPFQSLPVETNPVDAAGYVIRVNEKNGASTLQPDQPVELVFDLSTVPLPVWATDVYMNIIYENEITSKPMAVAFNDISEPTPVEIFNNTDKSCIKGQWYDSGSAAALAAVDDNNNSLADENDIFTHSLTNIYAKMSSSTNSIPASAATFNLQEPGPVLANGLPKRLGYILTDYLFKYSVLETWVHTDPNDTWVRTEIPAMHPGTAIKNQVTSGTYTYPGMYVMRGEKMWWGSSVIYDNAPYPPGQSADHACGWENIQ